MDRTRKWIFVLVAFVIATALISLWSSHVLSQCTFSETPPEYSADHRYYVRIQATICRDDAETRFGVVLGESGTRRSVVLLDLRSSLDTMHYMWHEGPELHVQVPESSIIKRYGPYDDWPRIVVTSP